MNQKSLGRVGLVAARAQPSVLNLGQTSWARPPGGCECRQKVPWFGMANVQ